MTKQEFIDGLKQGLVGLPQGDIEEHLAFYSEMIDDMIEDGISEEEAVAHIGEVEKIASQIIGETSLSKIVKEKIKPKRKLRAWEIVLIVLGSPLWFPITVSIILVLLALYISFAAVLISIWAVFVSLVFSGIFTALGGVVYAFSGSALKGIAFVGAGMVLIGLGILSFFLCKAITKGTIKGTKLFFIRLKEYFVKKGEN